MKLRATALLALCVAGSACGDGASVEEGPAAPSGTALWARQFGNSTELDPIDLAVDGAGNVLVAGRFFATADFGAGPVTSPANNWQAFVAKYDAAGALLWMKSFGDVYEERATHVGVDSSGNVYLGGEFRGSVDFGGGVLESDGFGWDIFVAKLAPDGSHLWSKRFGVSGSEALQAMEVEPAGSIGLLGSAGDGTDLGTGPMTFEGSPFLAKLETSGEAVFVTPFAGFDGDNSYAYPTAFAYGADGMAIALMSYDELGNMQIGVRRIGPGGEPRWQREITSGGGDGVSIVELRDDGAVFLAGQLWSFLDFGNGISASPLATSSGSAFLAKLAADGAPEWAHLLSPQAVVNVDGIELSGSIAPQAIAAASDGVIITGGFIGAVDFGGGVRLSASMSDSIEVDDYYYSPADDVFVARYGDAGNHVWDAPFGSRARQRATSAGFDPSGDVFVAGSGQLDASVYYHGFVVKLAR
jgi:hypothetical protein